MVLYVVGDAENRRVDSLESRLSLASLFTRSLDFMQLGLLDFYSYGRFRFSLFPPNANTIHPSAT